MGYTRAHDSSDYTLAFDFSSTLGSICLWRDSRVCVNWVASDGEFVDKAEILPHALRDIFEKAFGKRFNDTFVGERACVRRLCVVRGPGSYTGLRASLAAANGLKLAWRGLEVCSVTSFEAAVLATRANLGRQRTENAMVLTLIESFRSDCYAQPFWHGSALSAARAYSNDALRALVLELSAQCRTRGADLLLCGGAASRAKEEVLRDLNKQGLNLHFIDNAVTADNFSYLLVTGRTTNERLPSYATGKKALEPLYIGYGV